jgi:TetR/AcrR family transcriptional regulator, transcriptional repressor for nem operon
MISTIDPRERLVLAAAKLIHKQGFARTTLADIAQAAKVALGSVYYYFRSKDDIAAAIMAKRVADIDQMLIKKSQLPDPRLRLEALLQVWVEDRETDARYGCPIGSLCYELAKGRGALSHHAALPLRTLIDWCAAQFRALGHKKDAPAMAVHLVAALQGISLVANSLGEPAAITREAAYLKAWLNTL